MDVFALCLTPKNYFHIFVVGDSPKVCTWVAKGTGQVVYTSASVGARSHSGASSSARHKAESGTASSQSLAIGCIGGSISSELLSPTAT